MKDEEIKQYLNWFQTKFYIVPIDKVSNNFFLFIRNSVSRLFDEIGLRDTHNDIESYVNSWK